MAIVTVSDERLKRADDLVDWITAAMADFSFTATYKTRAAAACLTIAQEHHKAVVLLTSRCMYTSSYGLCRNIFDSFVRGAWLATCATEDKAEKFFFGEEPPKMNALLLLLEKQPEFANGELTAIKARYYGTLCDFTHTGGLQVQRWNTDDFIEPNYLIEEVLEMLKFAELLGVMSLTILARLVGRVELATTARDKLRELQQELKAMISP